MLIATPLARFGYISESSTNTTSCPKPVHRAQPAEHVYEVYGGHVASRFEEIGGGICDELAVAAAYVYDSIYIGILIILTILPCKTAEFSHFAVDKKVILPLDDGFILNL